MEIKTIMKNKEIFKDWFIKTYVQHFNEVPKIKNFDTRKLKEIEKEKERKEIEKYIGEVLKVVSLSLFGRDLSNEVLQKGKSGDINLVRKISLYIMCDMLNFSKTLTGDMVKKDRTTVIHHCKTIGGILQVDKVFKKKFENILKKLEERGLVTFSYKNEEAKIYKNY
jgi:chromosomal replication initiation ATPase DnaA